MAALFFVIDRFSVPKAPTLASTDNTFIEIIPLLLAILAFILILFPLFFFILPRYTQENKQRNSAPPTEKTSIKLLNKLSFALAAILLCWLVFSSSVTAALLATTHTPPPHGSKTATPTTPTPKPTSTPRITLTPIIPIDGLTPTIPTADLTPTVTSDTATPTISSDEPTPTQTPKPPTPTPKPKKR